MGSLSFVKSKASVNPVQHSQKQHRLKSFFSDLFRKISLKAGVEAEIPRRGAGAASKSMAKCQAVAQELDGQLFGSDALASTIAEVQLLSFPSSSRMIVRGVGS